MDLQSKRLIEPFAIAVEPHIQNEAVDVCVRCSKLSQIQHIIDLSCKWLNTGGNLVFIWPIHPIFFLCQTFFQNGISNWVLNFCLVYQRINIKAMLGMLGGGENLCDWLFMMEILPLGYHCMRTWQSLYLSEAGCCSWNTEPLVILTACLFSFVVGEHEMRPSCTWYHLNYHCRWKILLILRHLNKKQGINTKKYCSSWENKAS